MLKKYPYICIVLLIISLFACSKPQEGENYFPKTSEGSKWEYGLRFSTSSDEKLGSMIISIEDDETINGKKYYKQISQVTGVPGEGAHTSYNRRSKEGIYKIDESTSSRQEYLLIPFPLKPGDTWTTQVSGGKSLYKAEKIETLDLNGKKYENCLKISVQGEKGSHQFEGLSYFAPNIGEVYTVLNMGEVKIDYALVKYKL